MPLKKHQANYYLEYDEILEPTVEDECTTMAAVRKSLGSRQPPEANQGALPKVLGPEPDETTSLPTRTLRSPGQPSAAERTAHEAHHLPYRPWRPLCVQARAADNPRRSLEPPEEGSIPKVGFDIFFVGSDKLAQKYKLLDGYFTLREKERLTTQEVDQTISVLNVIDCRSLAQGTLRANKELDEYKISYIIAMLEQRGHATVILQTDQENATMAVANAVRDRRA